MQTGVLLRAALIGAVMTLAGGLYAPSAQADTINITLGLGNADLSGFTGPYANVDVNLTSTTTATITFTGLANGGFQYLFGGGQAADVSVNSASFFLTNLTASNSITGFTAPLLTTIHLTGTADGFGTFLTFDLFNGFTNAATSISFKLTNASGTWTTAASVLTANALGFTAAAHIFACAVTCTVAEGAATTGFAANGGVATTPLPAALPLFTTGLGALGLLGWRRMRKAAA